jgi:hypothetical protein
VFSFVQRLCGCDFREAVRQVARIAARKSLSLPAVGLVAQAPIFPHVVARGVGGRRPPRSSRHAFSRECLARRMREEAVRMADEPPCLACEPGRVFFT